MVGTDKRYLRIKERLLDQALDLWGIEDERQLDPVVDLLLESVAFESFQLEETLRRADAALLGRFVSLAYPSEMDPSSSLSCLAFGQSQAGRKWLRASS